MTDPLQIIAKSWLVGFHGEKGFCVRINSEKRLGRPALDICHMEVKIYQVKQFVFRVVQFEY